MENKIHIPGRNLIPAKPGERPCVKVSVDAYNALIEIGNESTLSLKDIASLLILEASKLVVYDR